MHDPSGFRDAQSVQVSLLLAFTIWDYRGAIGPQVTQGQIFFSTSSDRIIGIDLCLMRSLNRETNMRESRGREPTKNLQLANDFVGNIKDWTQGSWRTWAERQPRTLLQGGQDCDGRCGDGPDESQERTRGKVWLKQTFLCRDCETLV